MILSIHQPQYLPWLPYFMKIAESDLFILLDSVDFQKNGLQNRNQIKCAQGAQWLTVPVKQRLGQKILDVEIDTKVDWRKKHQSSIRQNYGKSAWFKAVTDEVEAAFEREWHSLNALNMHFLSLMLRWLGIERRMIRSSEMKAVGRGSELILNLCIETGARQYISGTGGRNYLEEEAFREAGIEIIYRSPRLPVQYPQMHPQMGFLGGLSALDIVLNCGQNWRAYVPGLATID